MGKTILHHAIAIQGELVKLPTVKILKCPHCGDFPLVRRMAAYDEQLNEIGVKWGVHCSCLGECLGESWNTLSMHTFWHTLAEAVEDWNIDVGYMKRQKQKEDDKQNGQNNH